MRFQAPQLGALGVTFTAVRIAQFIALISVVGLTANFINEIVTAQYNAPDVLVGTLVVSSIAVLYIVINYILYYDGMLPLLYASILDFALLIATIVVASTVGKPLSKLNCYSLPASTTNIFSAVASVGSNGSVSRAVDYFTYAAVDQPHCYEIKAVWGLNIALCVLFAFSSFISIALWRRIKTLNAPPPKDIEG